MTDISTIGRNSGFRFFLAMKVIIQAHVNVYNTIQFCTIVTIVVTKNLQVQRTFGMPQSVGQVPSGCKQ